MLCVIVWDISHTILHLTEKVSNLQIEKGLEQKVSDSVLLKYATQCRGEELRNLHSALKKISRVNETDLESGEIFQAAGFKWGPAATASGTAVPELESGENAQVAGFK